MTNLVQVCNSALARLGSHQAISSLTENSQLAGTCRNFIDEARRSCLASFDWPFAKVFAPLAMTGNQPPPRWTVEYARPACIRVRSLDVMCPTTPLLIAGGTPGPIPSGSASYLDFGGAVLPVGGPQYQGVAQPNTPVMRSPTVIPFCEGAVPVPTTQLQATQTVTPPPPPPPATSADPFPQPGTSTVSTTYTSFNQPGGVVSVIWTNVLNAGAWMTVDVLDPNAWEPGFVNALGWFLAAEIAVNVTGSAQVQEAMMQGAQNASEKAMQQGANEETLITSWNADWIDARDGFGGPWGSGYGDGYGYGP